MNIIAHNPYRILGVFANDPIKVRTANIARIRAFNKVGKECHFDSDFLDIFGSIDRSRESVEKAYSLLSSEVDAELYACLWLHRTSEIDLAAKAPIDIIHSAIGKNDKSNLVNVAIGSLLADNLDLAAETFVHLFECDDAPTDEIKKYIIHALEDGYKGEYDLPFSWWKRFKLACSQGHHETLDFIREVYYEESIKYLHQIARGDIFKNTASRFTAISIPHQLAKSVIKIVGETSNLETNLPNAEAQIALSEYANVVLKACKKYYSSIRFWDTKPAEDLLILLKEIYKISYSSKTKDECEEFGKKIKSDAQYLAPAQVKSQANVIRKEIESFCEKPNETRWSLLLVKNTVGSLVSIKAALGADNLYYRRISTQIADNALYVSQMELDSAKRKVNSPRNDKTSALHNLKRVSQQATQLAANLMLLDVEESFAITKLKRFNDDLEKCVSDYEFVLDEVVPTISLSTDDDLYRACADYKALVEFTRKYPDSPHFKDAIQRIWKIEDDEYPQIGKSILAYRRAFFAYKEKFPSSHNEQKLLEKINQFFLQNTLGTVYDYRTILRLWPNHPQKSLIEKRIDDAAFKQCSSVSGWQGYLADFPNGLHRKEALGCIAQAEEAEKANKEQKAFDGCKTIADYNRFILKFPTSNLYSKACTHIEDLVWAQTKRIGNFDHYLKEYPHGRYSREAKRFIELRLAHQRELEEKKTFEACKKCSDFKTFLKMYPDGIYKEIANAVIQRRYIRRGVVVSTFTILVTLIIVLSFMQDGLLLTSSTVYLLSIGGIFIASTCGISYFVWNKEGGHIKQLSIVENLKSIGISAFLSIFIAGLVGWALSALVCWLTPRVIVVENEHVHEEYHLFGNIQGESLSKSKDALYIQNNTGETLYFVGVYYSSLFSGNTSEHRDTIKVIPPMSSIKIDNEPDIYFEIPPQIISYRTHRNSSLKSGIYKWFLLDIQLFNQYRQ